MSILDDIGIHINTETEVPELREYVEYYRDAPWLLKLLRTLFRARKVNDLRYKSQQAMLCVVLEKGLKTLEGADMKPILEIDGELIGNDYEYYDDPLGGHQLGADWGMDEATLPDAKVRGFLPTKPLCFVNVWKHMEDGSIWGIHAAFRHGKWDKDEDGNVMWKVWDRIV